MTARALDGSGGDRFGPAARQLRPTGRGLLTFGCGVSIVLLTVWVAANINGIDLAVVLLVVLVEVLAIATFTGPILAVVAALVAVIVVNWFLVPPFHTFAIDSPENVVTLVVFTVVAVVASVLVELSGRARATAARAFEQTELLGEVVGMEAESDSTNALEQIRQALTLDRVVLLQGSSGRENTLLDVGNAAPESDVALEVDLPEGYRLLGFGPARIGADKAFLQTLGAAAVLAFEGQLLDEERQRVTDLAAIDRARTALLASVGHDLRTPLAGLRVAVDALQQPDAGLAPADRIALLETISQSTSRLDELISNLLDMSRLEAGAIIAHLEPTPLDEVVARAVLETEGAEVAVDVSDELPQVASDPVLLERIVANLVSNAMRYGQSSTPVSVTAKCHHDSVLLDVVDHGAGFVDRNRAAAFEAFRSAGEHGTGGAGLGLAIVAGFAAAMDVEIDMFETAGGGLTVRLTIPLARRRSGVWRADA